MMIEIISLAVFLVTFFHTYEASTDIPFSMIDAVQTECEYQGLTIGSRLADAFNSYGEEIPIYRRLQHPYYNHHQLFHRMAQKELSYHNQLLNRNGILHEESSSSVVLGNGHVQIYSHPNISRATGESFLHKWIYFLGDSSLLPLRNVLLDTLHGRGGHSHAKEKCVENEGFGKEIDDVIEHIAKKRYNQVENRKTCHNHGMGQGGKISFERHDYLLEKFQSKFFEQHPLLTMDIQTHIQHNSTSVIRPYIHKYPDVLIVQVGYETCMQSTSGAGQRRQEWLPHTEKNIAAFMESLRKMIEQLQQRRNEKNSEIPDGISSQSNNITVIISLPGRDPHANDDTSFCVWKLGRMIAVEAHRNHFLLLEREEIEHRLVIRWEYGFPDALKELGQDFTLESLLNFPAPQIVTSALASILYCLNRNMTLSLE